MENVQEKTFFETNYEAYYRFTKKELLEQKKDLLLYIVFNLTPPNINGMKESIREIKQLTGASISVDRIRQLQRHTVPIEQTLKTLKLK